MTMTDTPRSRAMIAAGRPEAPAPMMTTSAVLSHRVCASAVTPARAVAPTPMAVPSLMNRRRLRAMLFSLMRNVHRGMRCGRAFGENVGLLAADYADLTD